MMTEHEAAIRMVTDVLVEHGCGRTFECEHTARAAIAAYLAAVAPRVLVTVPEPENSGGHNPSGELWLCGWNAAVKAMLESALDIRASAERGEG